jgi:hypothetical protein
LDSAEGEVIFEKGQLVQVYRSDIAKSIGFKQKLMPMWSEPHIVLEKLLNSYKLEALEGQPLEGEFHSQRLPAFKPRKGMELALQQNNLEAREAWVVQDLT